MIAAELICEYEHWTLSQNESLLTSLKYYISVEILWLLNPVCGISFVVSAMTEEKMYFVSGFFASGWLRHEIMQQKLKQR